jgi:hypothetical protein
LRDRAYASDVYNCVKGAGYCSADPNACEIDFVTGSRLGAAGQTGGVEQKAVLVVAEAVHAVAFAGRG